MLSLIVASAAMLSCAVITKQQQPAVVDLEPYIVVTGSSEVRVAPDLATVSVGITTQAKTAQEAQNQANSKATDFLSRVKTLIGSKGTVQTGSVNLYPVYSQPGPADRDFTPMITGYRADNTLSIRVTDFTLIGPVIDTAVGAGLNNVQSVSFGLQDDSDARMKALAEAVKQARKKADVIASAAGVSIWKLRSIGEQGADIRPPMPQAMFARGAGSADVSTPVEPGEIVVSGSVTVTYLVQGG